MKNEHKRFEATLESILPPIGFKQVSNDEFSIVYGNDVGWTVSVDSERYYEGVFRWIKSPDGYSYSVFILIRTFEILTRTKVVLKKSDDWIRFISQNKDWIFINSQPYRQCYEEIDQ